MIETLLTIGELASAISSMSELVPSPPADLTDKHRWMTVTVFNQTQFEIVWTGNDYFDSGRFWAAPTNVNSFNSMTFSACDTDGSFLTGCSGGAVFNILLSDGSTTPFAIGFTNPQAGAIKSAVVLSSNPEDGYNAAIGNSMSVSTNPVPGVDDKGNPVNLFFHLASSPGQEATITVTQMEQVPVPSSAQARS